MEFKFFSSRLSWYQIDEKVDKFAHLLYENMSG